MLAPASGELCGPAEAGLMLDPADPTCFCHHLALLSLRLSSHRQHQGMGRRDKEPPRSCGLWDVAQLEGWELPIFSFSAVKDLGCQGRA